MDALAWPAAVVVFGVFFVLVFRKNIAAFLDRTKSVSKEGIVAYEEQQKQLPKPADAITQFLEAYQSPLLLEVEANLGSELEKRGLTNVTDANKALRKSLAGLMIEYLFEATENVIFASQVEALTLLNTRAPAPTPLSQLEPFFQTAAAKFPTMYADRTLQDWLGFLTSRVLVNVNEEGASLTLRGREYLKWRVEQGRAHSHFG